jgi:hypothetical protein
MAKRKRYHSPKMPSGMGEFANLPQSNYSSMYPDVPSVSAPCPDTERAVYMQISHDVSKLRSSLKPAID